MTVTDVNDPRALLLAGDPRFFAALAERTCAAEGVEILLTAAALRRKAAARGLIDPRPASPVLRLAILGGYSFHPLREVLAQQLWADGVPCELFTGEYDNYVAEILEPGVLDDFRPDVVFLWPPARRCTYAGALTDGADVVRAAARSAAEELLGLARRVHDRTRAEVVVTSFLPSPHHDLGPFRARTLGSDWTFRRQVNLELGATAPPFVHICDLEFLAYRRGGLAAHDPRLWFESKQPCAPALMLDVARELAAIVGGIRRGPHKVLVLDLDNTLWGGVVGDLGVEGIELGDTSPRGEAFKAFQAYVRSLKERGVLLAVCSKNDLETAREPFERHPEMVLRLDDLVAFKANWEPKSDNIREIAAQLSLGLDSFVFVDDTPAEIEIVRQFTPEVKTILLGPDPADYVGVLKDCRYFEPRAVTAEDLARTRQYQQEARRQVALETATDMEAYLASLEMKATFHRFRDVDVARIAQLINKSNQFNLTTRRRSEADVQSLVDDAKHACFTVRLADRFGDHGLIAVVILALSGGDADVDTWLMSCRVLKRQVEDETVNAVVRLAARHGCRRVVGRYRPTPKNGMVRALYERMGFARLAPDDAESVYACDVAGYLPKPSHIALIRAEGDAAI